MDVTVLAMLQAPFPSPKFALFFWQWGFSPLHPRWRFHLSDLQERGEIIRVFIGQSSPTALAVTSQKWKNGQVTTHHSLLTVSLFHFKPIDKCILTFLSACSLLHLVKKNLYNHTLIGFLLFSQCAREGVELYNVQEVRPGW